MQIESRERQSSNARAPMKERFEGGSKVTFRSDRHCRKEKERIDTTDEGRWIEQRAEHERNAPEWISAILEPRSNVTEISEEHSQKHFEYSASTEAGM
jgi:hypothetical protein